MAEWNSFADVEALRREIGRAFEDFGFEQGQPHRDAFLPGREPRRYPLVNLLEDKDNIYVEALTPGVDPESINFNALQNRLTLAGEKSGIPGDVKPEAFHRNERASEEVCSHHRFTGRDRRDRHRGRIQKRAAGGDFTKSRESQAQTNQR